MKNKDYLTDEFIAFSKEIENILTRKKALQAEMSEYYAEFKLKMTALEEEAEKAKKKWETSLHENDNDDHTE